MTIPSPSTRTTSDQLLPAGGATFATTSCSLAGSVLLSPQAARASAPIEVRRTVRSRVMFFFLHKGANAGLLSGLERKVEFRFERGPGGDFGVAPVDEKTGRAFDMVGAAAAVGHAGEFGLRDLAAQRRVELRLGIAARAHQIGRQTCRERVWPDG